MQVKNDLSQFICKMSKFKLFDFQEVALNKCLEYLKKPKQKPGIAVCPTGWGKSGLIAEIARVSGLPTLVLQPSSILLEQNLDKLRLLGGDATVFSASLKTKEMSSLTFATLGSIKSLGKEFKRKGIKLLLIDECDGSYPPEAGSMFMDFVKDLCPDFTIGFTATPIRLKNTMEGSKLQMLNRTRPKFFHNIIYCMQIAEIIAAKRWTPIKYKPYEFDDNLLILNTSGSDFTEDSIKKYNEAKGINNKILLEVRELLAAGKSDILVFCDSVETAKTFAKHVPQSAAVYGDMPKKEKEDVLTKFKNKEIKVVFNMLILGVGYDHPTLSTIIFGRPTNSYRVYYQSLGRGVRIHPGKKEFTFIDYGGNVKRFGPIEQMEYIDHPINGWSMFAGDRLISGTSMGGAPVYKKDLIPKKELPKVSVPNYVIAIGKFSGKKLNEVKRSYLEYMIYTSGFDFSRGNMKVFYDTAKQYLEDTKLHVMA